MLVTYSSKDFIIFHVVYYLLMLWCIGGLDLVIFEVQDENIINNLECQYTIMTNHSNLQLQILWKPMIFYFTYYLYLPLPRMGKWEVILNGHLFICLKRTIDRQNKSQYNITASKLDDSCQYGWSPCFSNKSNIFIHLIWPSLWEQYIVGASSVFGRVAVFNPDFYIFLEYLFTSQKLLSLINILNKLNILVYSIMIHPTFLILVLEHTHKFTCTGNRCTLQYNI